MEKKDSINPLDLSVNAVLDVTPRKVGKLAFKLAKSMYSIVAQTEIKALRKEVADLKEGKG